jgi:hypothetical protein
MCGGASPDARPAAFGERSSRHWRGGRFSLLARLLRLACPVVRISHAQRETGTMHWVRITNPQYEQSARYSGQVGEVVGRWGPENSASAKDGYLVEFADGEIVSVTDGEVEAVEKPDVRPVPRSEGCD